MKRIANRDNDCCWMGLTQCELLRRSKLALLLTLVVRGVLQQNIEEQKEQMGKEFQSRVRSQQQPFYRTIKSHRYWHSKNGKNANCLRLMSVLAYKAIHFVLVVYCSTFQWTNHGRHLVVVHHGKASKTFTAQPYSQPSSRTRSKRSTASWSETTGHKFKFGGRRTRE